MKHQVNSNSRVFDQYRVEPVRYPHTSVLIIRTGCC
jgi:hypothetical protein